MDIDKANELRALIVALQKAYLKLISFGSANENYATWIAAGDAVEAFITNHTE